MAERPSRQVDLTPRALLPEDVVATLTGREHVDVQETDGSCTFTADGITVIGMTVTAGPPEHIATAVRQQGEPLGVGDEVVASLQRAIGGNIVLVTRRGTLVSVSDLGGGMSEEGHLEIAQTVAKNLREL